MSETRLIAAPARDPYHRHKLFHPYHLERARTLLDGEIPAPSTIEIDLTDGACNQACLHCCFGSGPHRALRAIDPDRLIAFIEAAYAHGTRAFELVGGGEPTNHPQVSEIIQRIHDAGLRGGEQARIGLVSNGVRLRRIFAVAHHLEWVRISLDAPDEATYSELHGVCAAQGALRQGARQHQRPRRAPRRDPVSVWLISSFRRSTTSATAW
jgi:sulfatase maturation enzyme AslB (radical SAM superfamily)